MHESFFQRRQAELQDGPSKGAMVTVTKNQVTISTMNPENTIYHTYVVTGDEAWYMKSSPVVRKQPTSFAEEAKRFAADQSEINEFLLAKMGAK